jgi:hypothetical protein
VVAVADLGVGGVLYREVSAILGLLLLVCGLSVLVAVAYDPLKRGGSVLWRHVSELTAE